MTIEDLAGMVTRGFDKTDETFARLEHRVERFDLELRAEMRE